MLLVALLDKGLFVWVFFFKQFLLPVLVIAEDSPAFLLLLAMRLGL